jgi:hypothetical protein
MTLLSFKSRECLSVFPGEEFSGPLVLTADPRRIKSELPRCYTGRRAEYFREPLRSDTSMGRSSISFSCLTSDPVQPPSEDFSTPHQTSSAITQQDSTEKQNTVSDRAMLDLMVASMAGAKSERKQ